MRISVLTSCTNKKAVSCAEALTERDFEQGEAHLRARERELDRYRRSAGVMYTGKQHVHLMRGVQTLRTRQPEIEVDIAIISAGYGVISEDKRVVPYERAFNGRGKDETQRLADQLSIPSDVREFLSRPADLILVLLGNKYIQAIHPDRTIDFGGPAIIFCGRESASQLPDWTGVKKVILSQSTAKRFSAAMVWLKGVLAEHLLVRISQHPEFIAEIQKADVNVIGELVVKNKQLSLYGS